MKFLFCSLISATAILASYNNVLAVESDVALYQYRSEENVEKKKEFFPSGEAMPENTIEHNSSCNAQNKKNKNENCHIKNDKYPQAYNRAARINPNPDSGWSFDAYASYIYWNVSQDQMDIAYEVQACTATRNVSYQDFTYHSGFKVGLGFGSNFDDWTVDAVYTRLHFTDTNSMGAPPPGNCPPGTAGGTSSQWLVCYPYMSLIGGQVTYAFDDEWKVGYDNVDLLLGRPFYSGTKLVLLPTFGLRGLWVQQTFDVSGTNTVGQAFFSENTSKTWNVGPVANLNSHWNIWKGFRFEGGLGASLLYTRLQKYENNQFLNNPATATTTGNTRKIVVQQLQSMTPTFDMGLGLGWGCYAFKHKVYFDLAARYDLTVIHNQNFRPAVNLIFVDNQLPAGDLRLHGLTLDFTVGF